MQKIVVHEGIAAPLKRSNVDTDQIISALYMKAVTRGNGFGDYLFEYIRKNEPDFVLNLPEYQGASVLVAGPDFATGSSREHAVWALVDYGFRVILSSRFADIFRGNSGKQGLLTAQLEQHDIERIWEYLDNSADKSIVVDLEKQEVRFGDNVAPFQVDPYIRYRLLNGLDDIDITLQSEDLIKEFESKRPSFKPKTLPAKTSGDAKVESEHYDTRSPIDPSVGIM
ncbi:MAG: 3-isopropylmalate dehydratase small subunit [Candidatus Ancillula sp.]|jgi:3-isopropylmalate/(R)-2-methylmalate dehydratase small subunit|nr:3-isopropylmalate dehydratase small subunit [Candidatus Ancillula sp.]